MFTIINKYTHTMNVRCIGVSLKVAVYINKYKCKI